MLFRSAACLACLAILGCGGDGAPDGGTSKGDGGAVVVADMAGLDLAVASDLSAVSNGNGDGGDLGGGPNDLSSRTDLLQPSDLLSPPDLTVDNNVYLDAVNGHDATGNGTRLAPYQTLSKGTSVAHGGQAIYCFPGTYANGTTLNVAANVGIQALTAGTVTISGNAGQMYPGGTLVFAGTGFVRDILLEYQSLSASTGTLTLDGVSFSKTTADVVSATGSVHVVFTPHGLASYVTATPPTGRLIFAGGTSVVDINGGTFSYATGTSMTNPLSWTEPGTQLTFNGVTVSNYQGAQSVYVNGNSVNGGTIKLVNRSLFDHCGNNYAVVRAPALGTILVDNSTLQNSVGTAIGGNTDTGATVTVQNGSLIQNGTGGGIVFYGASITVDHSTITGNQGIGVGSTYGGTSQILLTNAIISNNQSDGVDVGSIKSGASVKLRATQILNNRFDGLYININTDVATIDLGTSADPGGNTFAGNATTVTDCTTTGASYANVQAAASSNTAPVMVPAFGNTWNANCDGTDINGHYAAGTSFTATATNAWQHKNVRLSTAYPNGQPISLIAN